LSIMMYMLHLSFVGLCILIQIHDLDCLYYWLWQGM
jgi:hypothetical protein